METDWGGEARLNGQKKPQKVIFHIQQTHLYVLKENKKIVLCYLTSTML